MSTLLALFMTVGGLVNFPQVTLSATLITNGDVESGVLGDWTCTDELAVATDEAHGGTYSIKLDKAVAEKSRSCWQTITMTAGKRYRIGGWIKTSNLLNGFVRLSLFGGSGSAGSNCNVYACSSTDTVAGTTDWTFVESKFITETATSTTARIRITDYRSPSGQAWFDDIVVYEEIAPDIEALMTSPSYRGISWTDETANADFWITDNGSGAMEAVIDGEVPDDAPTTTAVTAGSNTIPFTFTEGTIGFRRVGGGAITYPLYRIIRTDSAERSTWNVSWTDDKRILFYGVKTFLLGVYDAGLGHTTVEASWESAWQDYRRLFDTETIIDPALGLPINAYLNYHFGNAGEPSMDVMKTVLWRDHGVLYWHNHNCFKNGYKGAYHAVDNPDGWLGLEVADSTYGVDIGTHSGFGGWYVVDECNEWQAEQIFDDFQTFKARSPKGANLVVDNGDVTLDIWIHSGDLVSTDAYPLPSGKLDKVGRFAAANRIALRDSRPFTTVLQYFKGPSASHFPLEPELRKWSYAAIVEGTQGIWYWSVGSGGTGEGAQGCNGVTWCQTKTDFRLGLKSVMDELSDIEHILVADDDTTSLETISVGVGPGGATRTEEVRAIVRNDSVSGDDYVFAYNYTGDQQTATFDWHEGLTSVTTKHPDGDTSISPVSDTWSDTFAAYEGHIYAVVDGGGGVVDPNPVMNVRARTFGETTIAVRFWATDMDYEADCNVFLRNAAGTLLDTGTSNSGLAIRRVIFDGLTASTLYNVSVDCVGFDPSEEIGVTTKAAGAGTTNFSFTRKPSAILVLGSIDSLKMSCTDIETACASNCTVTQTIADTCGSGCTATLALSRGRVYDCHHEWGTDGSTWVHVSPAAPYEVK